MGTVKVPTKGLQTRGFCGFFSRSRQVDNFFSSSLLYGPGGVQVGGHTTLVESKYGTKTLVALSILRKSIYSLALERRSDAF